MLLKTTIKTSNMSQLNITDASTSIHSHAQKSKNKRKQKHKQDIDEKLST